MNRRALIKALGLAPLAPMVVATPVAATIPVTAAGVNAGAAGWEKGFLICKDRTTGQWNFFGKKLAK